MNISYDTGLSKRKKKKVGGGEERGGRGLTK